MLLHTVDIALRSGATALLLMLSVLMLRDFGRVTAGRLAAAFALGSAAFAISSASGFSAVAVSLRAPFIALATGNVVVFWLFARALFDDGFQLRWWHAAAWAGLVCAGLLNCLVLVPAQAEGARLVGPALSLIALGFNALAIGQALTSWSADLVESRRRLRLFIVGTAAIYGAAYAGLQLLPGGEPPAFASTVNAAILATIVSVTAALLTRVTGANIFAAAAAAATTPDITTSAVRKAADAADLKLVDALDRLMADERIYRHERMTIGTLALKLNVPAYRLRRLINQHLGYRNFNVFLNNYRIEEAKAALSDPTQADVPVITIAMDAGFQSLGPFNRAFKTTTGVTPTEYRRINQAAA
ncbi:AraC family transcriptional regulator [Bradyrhizobium sp.]